MQKLGFLRSSEACMWKLGFHGQLQECGCAHRHHHCRSVRYQMLWNSAPTCRQLPLLRCWEHFGRHKWKVNLPCFGCLSCRSAVIASPLVNNVYPIDEADPPARTWTERVEIIKSCGHLDLQCLGFSSVEQLRFRACGATAAVLMIRAVTHALHRQLYTITHNTIALQGAHMHAAAA